MVEVKSPSEKFYVYSSLGCCAKSCDITQNIVSAPDPLLVSVFSGVQRFFLFP